MKATSFPWRAWAWIGSVEVEMRPSEANGTPRTWSSWIGRIRRARASSDDGGAHHRALHRGALRIEGRVTTGLRFFRADGRA
jgi:hypothetical protein